MRSLSDTIERLAAFRGAGLPTGAPAAHLSDLHGFGDNPGALRALTYVPAGLGRGAPLVVALHGCTQTAAGYDHGTGWSTLAEREGFALLLPEQARTNNANLCFNWFSPDDIARTGGEAESVAQMVRAMVDGHGLDPSRVFVTGLSAGGAMTAVMLATYPDLFAGGAVIGGLPYGCASSVPQAFERMRGLGLGSMSSAAAISRASGGYAGAWPSISLWHGTADATVNPANVDHLGLQWRDVHGIEGAVACVEHGAGWKRRVWRSRDGRDAVEEWGVAGMGHGVPIDPDGPDGLGASGPYMLDVGVSSTAMIARSWGLTSSTERRERATAVSTATAPTAKQGSAGFALAEPGGMNPPAASGGVQKVIEDALRTAGLMR